MNKENLEKQFERRFSSTGDNWKAQCPFHDDKTPSFYVHQTEYIGNCFGCGTAGYIDVLLAKYAAITPEKARELLDINIIERVTRDKRPKKREQQVFPESWLAAWPRKLHKYILERYDARETAIEIFGSAGCRYDPIGKRQVFPHRNREGDLIGAFGRSCINQKPKWYFYWDYTRGNSLYHARLKRSKELFLIEGALDVIRLEEYGQLDAQISAPIGTFLGPGQIAEVKEYDHVYIAFDNDANEAGRQGTEKLYSKIKKSCRVSFVSWPEWSKDPMEGPMNDDQITECIANSMNYVQRQSLLRANTSS